MKSIWVFHLNTGACNGCDIEIVDVLTPYHDIERLGVKLVSTPRHAHALLVTGPLTRQAYYAAKKAYESMPKKPRIVIAVGTCACSGGIFYNSYPIRREYERLSLEYPRKGGTSEFLPVDLYIPGCPPRPEEILFGIALLRGIAQKKVHPERYSPEELVLPRTQLLAWVELILRRRVRYELGYFDGYKLLSRFMELVEMSEEPEELKKLVEREKELTDDSRLRYGLEKLYEFYLEVLEEYRRILAMKKKEIVVI
ncbi:NADH-quinone oxidoreductase subunit B family protein [Thermococcus barophilus]|uniref:Membrane bound subgroup 4b [NiFe]-hydrogenase MBH(B)1, subunit Mbh(B)1J n=1 Tax=Thermococcus barophilus TaxID=55802 RepID=A0A0S1XA31_THEBA|nr:NADH-quinone oxidoreductase subunit B family protein [Thermococcus barophilus]ALM74612.1 Membrane bound subgroup 4b [NiFe]-hydrogenase MBH(b)1, subunit Mbh(b)1J [Thermococcus barophilus]